MGDDERAKKMLADPRRSPISRAVGRPRTARRPVLTAHLRKNGLEARIFTTISTIGTPIDATAEDRDRDLSSPRTTPPPRS